MPFPSVSISIETEPVNSFERYLQVYHDAGFRQLQAFWRRGVIMDTDRLVKVVNQFDCCFDSVHGRFGNDLDPSSLDEGVRRRTIEAAEEDGEFARELGGSIVIIHPSCKIPKELGFDIADRGSWGDAVEAERGPMLMQSMEEMAGIGEELEVLFAVENVPGKLWIGCDSVQLAEMIRRVDSPFVRMCFDVGHAHVESDRYGSCAEQLARCLDVVSYFHVHDNDGKRDSHEAPGDGTVDWNELSRVMKDASGDAIVMLEMFRGVEEMGEVLERPIVCEILHDLAGG